MKDPKHPYRDRSTGERTKRRTEFAGSFHHNISEAIASQAGDAKHRSIWEVNGKFIVASSMRQVMEAYLSGMGISINRLWRSEIRKFLSLEQDRDDEQQQAELNAERLAQ